MIRANNFEIVKITLRKNFIFGKTRGKNGCEKYPFYSNLLIYTLPISSRLIWMTSHTTSMTSTLTFALVMTLGSVQVQGQVFTKGKACPDPEVQQGFDVARVGVPYIHTITNKM